MKLREVFQQRGIEGVLDEIDARLESAKQPEKKDELVIHQPLPTPGEEEVKNG